MLARKPKDLSALSFAGRAEVIPPYKMSSFLKIAIVIINRSAIPFPSNVTNLAGHPPKYRKKMPGRVFIYKKDLTNR